jgi:hypothetical protein
MEEKKERLLFLSPLFLLYGRFCRENIAIMQRRRRNGEGS